MPLVVDASVAVKWFVPEQHAAEARSLLAARLELVAPEVLAAEFGNVAWTKQRRGELSPQEASEMVRGFARFGVRLRPIAPLMLSAFAMAQTTGGTVYDCLYLAVAEREGFPLVTADRRFFNAIISGSFSDRVLWIEDVP